MEAGLAYGKYIKSWGLRLLGNADKANEWGAMKCRYEYGVLRHSPKTCCGFDAKS